jgi:hypothetical protein
MERLHARTTLAVRVDGGDFSGQAGKAGDGIGADASEFISTSDVTEGDVLDHFTGDFGVAVEECADNLRAGLIKAGGDEFAPASTRKGRPHSIDDNSVLLFQ